MYVLDGMRIIGNDKFETGFRNWSVLRATGPSRVSGQNHNLPILIWC